MFTKEISKSIGKEKKKTDNFFNELKIALVKASLSLDNDFGGNSSVNTSKIKVAFGSNIILR